MSKIENPKPEQALTIETAALPLSYVDELKNFKLAAAEGLQASFLGTLLLFRQGEWVYGAEKQKLKPGTQLIALMNEARRGMVKWLDKKAVSHKVGKISEGFVVPAREDLDDVAEDMWPVGPDGKRKDPWAFTMFLPLVSPEGDHLFTYSTSSVGGTQAIYMLIDRYAWIGEKHPGQFPIVELGLEGYYNKKYSNTTLNPTFKIISWVDRPSLGVDQKISAPTAAAETNEPPPHELPPDDMSDEIPF